MKKNDKEFGQVYTGTAAAVAGKRHLITSIFIAKKIILLRQITFANLHRATIWQSQLKRQVTKKDNNIFAAFFDTTFGHPGKEREMNKENAL